MNIAVENTLAAHEAPQRRTRQMARAERRAQLLHLARQLVAAHGLAGLTMNALSDAAGVAKTVVYSHFANRHQVAIALLDEHFNAFVDFVMKQTAPAKTLEQYVSLFVDSTFAFEGTTDTPLRKITNGFSAGDEVNRAYQAYEEKAWRQWQRLLIAQGIPRETAEIGAYAISSMTTGTVLYYAIQPDNEHARATLKQLMTSTIGALIPEQGKQFKTLPDFNPDDVLLDLKSAQRKTGKFTRRQ